MINLIKKFTKFLFYYKYGIFSLMQNSIMCYYCLQNVKFFFSSCIKPKNLFNYVGNLFNLNFLILDLSNLESVVLTKMSSSVEFLKVQELIFLSEYFLVTALFCLTLFALVSPKIIVAEKRFFIKFKYNNQLFFLLVFALVCYLALVFQQINISLLTLTSFNDTIYNDQLSFISKLIIGISSILYLVLISQYLKRQQLSNVEYYIILLTSIFGFFLLCGANDLITAYLAIELQGLAFYILASFKKSSNFSIESGVKYFVLGSLSTALFLLGATFIYALSGSLLLTDFKDFFLWIFATHSIFLSLNSVSEILEVFQEKTNVTVADGCFEKSKMQILFDKFNLLKNNFLNSEICLFKQNFNEAEFSSYALEILIKFYCRTDLISSFIDKNFLQIFVSILSVNDFLIENIFQNMLVEFCYFLPNNQLDYESFTSFKTNLIKANYYKNSNLDKSEGFLTHNLIESSNFFQINNNIDVEFCLNSIYNSVQNCYFSDFVINILSFSEFFQTHESILDKTLLETKPEFVFILKTYVFPVISIVNFNNFFLEPLELATGYKFIFDFSLVIPGMLLIILSLFFKLALAPFHFWAPDVYEGSPSSSTFFFMVISKFSIFVFLLRICYSSFYTLFSYWQFYSLAIATFSIFIGAIVGLKQRKLKSLLTYSSISNMGFVLLAFSVGNFEGIQAKFYYLIVYTLGSLSIWSIILNLKLKKKMYFDKQNKDLGDLALLSESNQIMAQNLGITLFSLAGLPPTIGFFAKMGVFKALIGVSMYFFAIINILFSIIATFYYLRIIKIIFFENVLVGNLYEILNSKKMFLVNLLSFSLLFLFINPMFLYLYSYKITLFLNKMFY